MDLVTFAGNATAVLTTDHNKEAKNHTIVMSATLSNIKAILDGIIPLKFIVYVYKYR
jgi:type IV secretion system protein VirB8